MKKFCILMVLGTITFCFGQLKAQNSLSMVAGIESVSLGSPSSSTAYGLFNYRTIPLSNKNLTIGELFPDMKNKENVSSVVREYTEENWGGGETQTLRFNEKGQLVYKEQVYFGCGGERLKYNYDNEGNLIRIDVQYQESAQDSPIPFVKATYNYKWDNGRLQEIEETLMIDDGMQYSGQPIHLKFLYDQNGKPSKAVCTENPNIFYHFDSKGNLTNFSGYRFEYNYDNFDNIDWETDIRIGEAFDDYIVKKIGINWEIEEYPVDSTDYKLEMFNPDTKASYKYDTTGNWTQAQWYGPLEFDDDGYITITRKITYR